MDLIETLRLHALYLSRDLAGVRANLRGANLRDANLRGVNLRGADLRGADLRSAYLGGVNLRGANLRGANLRDANLRDANLRDADLVGANLRGADLWDADLWSVNLRGANLRGADLRGANLRGVDLVGATGLLFLTQTDHGYLVYASWVGTEWRIMAGCRNFSIPEARAHWSSSDYRLPQSGSRIVALLDWLEKQPTPEKETQP